MAHVSVNTATVAQLNSGIDAVTTTIVLSVPTFSGWPSTFPYWAIIARGTSLAEIVEVTAGTGASLTATRGRDGTVAAPHNAGDTFEHIIPADTANRTELHIDGTAAHGATGANVGTTNAQTLTNKLYQGGHKHVFTDANPAALTAGFESVADNTSARDGFVHRNTGGDVDRRGFLLEQSGTPRIEAYNDGTVKVTPNGSATRKGIETTTSLKAGTTLEVGTNATITGNTTVGGTLGVTGATTLSSVSTSGNATIGGNETVAGTLGVTGATTLAGATISGTTAVSTLTVSGTAAITGATSLAAGATAYGGTVPIPVVVSALANITSPVDKQLAMLSTNHQLYRYDGSAWKRATPLGGATTATRAHGRYVRTADVALSSGDNLATFPTTQQATDLITVSGTNNTSFALQASGLWQIECGFRASASSHEISIYTGTAAFNMANVIAQSQGVPCVSTSTTKYFASGTTIRINWYVSGAATLAAFGETAFLAITYLGREE